MFGFPVISDLSEQSATARTFGAASKAAMGEGFHYRGREDLPQFRHVARFRSPVNAKLVYWRFNRIRLFRLDHADKEEQMRIESCPFPSNRRPFSPKAAIFSYRT